MEKEPIHKIIVNKKIIDTNSLMVEDVHRYDYPDFCDAFISEAKCVDGNNLNGRELEELEQSYPGLAGQLAIEQYWDLGT